ncbi:MAG: 50S ribosomal protein L11 methyltransferase [Pseudomonadota bacterium]|nr:50S ribosomal protein L11 methyltransferase [Pseudomonadota bacterium]
MPWQQFSLEAGDLNPEFIADFFESQGALSVSFVDAADQPLFESEPGTTPLWSATRVTGLFAEEADLLSLKQQLKSTFGAAAFERLGVETLVDQDWERIWLDEFHPMQFGRRLWVCPAGQRPAYDRDAVLMDLDPGLAFGTGTHATTALCLQWLDRHPPENQQVLDYGCGSGILAIAALKLGAAAAWGVDIDPQALWASRENAVRNGVDAGLMTGLPDALPDKCFDVVLANILANPLIELAPGLAGRVRSGGDLVLSGILAEQADAVRAAFEPWFSLSDTVERDGWVRLHGVRD